MLAPRRNASEGASTPPGALSPSADTLIPPIGTCRGAFVLSPHRLQEPRPMSLAP